MDNSDPRLKQSRAALTLGALGIVFGDIGTSPLYAVKETFADGHGIALAHANIIGGISAILWAITLVVSLKYVLLIMRANNRGEGGIMALLALAISTGKDHPRRYATILLAGLTGAALFYGDAVLTPAISVLSAVEGLEIGTAAFKPYVLPIAVGVLIVLFSFQRYGTGRVGAWFGPIVVVWFITLGIAGIHNIVQAPAILQALDPRHGLAFVTEHGVASFLVLGAVLLAFTGAEALYADMGHFGKDAIRTAWFGLVFPGLALNYLGQGALLMMNPEAVHNPFYLLFPQWALYPMVALATVATVIASQATISGAFSLTRQAIQLGYLPRMTVLHTSAKDMGQIYLPAVNWTLLAVVIAAVIGFGSSSGLASAYGVAVTGTMLIDTFLTFFVIRFVWRYNLLLCIAATGFFILIDLAFFSSSLVKVAQGGWLPLALGAAMFTVMLTWARGRRSVVDQLRASAIPLSTFLKSLFEYPPHRVSGTAVFMVANPDAVPHALLHNLSHNKVLHERVVFLTVTIKDVPWVPFSERVSVTSLGNGCWQVIINFGFKNQPDVPQALGLCREHGLVFEMMETSFFLSRETLIPAANGGIALWRERMFAAMARNASSVVHYFNLPTNRVIELGTQIEI
ncbi:MAG: potassium transporter Kup [Burkholderiales bacterium]